MGCEIWPTYAGAVSIMLSSRGKFIMPKLKSSRLSKRLVESFLFVSKLRLLGRNGTYKIGAFSTTTLLTLYPWVKYIIGMYNIQDWSVSTTRLERSPQQPAHPAMYDNCPFWKTLTWSHYFIKRGSLWNAIKVVSWIHQ
jgi:hypothetical protein